MTAFKVRVGLALGGGHKTLRVFAGKDAEHLALTGVLIMRPAEAEDFLRSLGSRVVVEATS